MIRLLILCIGVNMMLTSCNLDRIDPVSAEVIQFRKLLSISGIDSPYELITDQDSNYVIVGRTKFSSSDLNLQAFIMRIDQNGNIIKTQKLGASKNDFANSVVMTDDGGFLVIGQANDLAGERSMAIWKLDKFLAKKDSLFYGVAGEVEEGVGIVSIGNDNYKAAYTTYVSGDFIALRFVEVSSSLLLGTPVIGQNADVSELDINKMIRTSENGFVLVGSIMDAGIQRAYVGKFMDNGAHIWHNIYPSIGSSQDSSSANNVIEASDHNYYVTGILRKPSDQDFLLLKITPTESRNKISVEGGGMGNEKLLAITSAKDGNLIVLGSSYNAIASKNSIYITKLSITDPHKIWGQFYTEDNAWPNRADIVTASDGGFVISARQEDPLGGILLFKTDSLGIY